MSHEDEMLIAIYTDLWRRTPLWARFLIRFAALTTLGFMVWVVIR